MQEALSPCPQNVRTEQPPLTSEYSPDFNGPPDFNGQPLIISFK